METVIAALALDCISDRQASSEPEHPGYRLRSAATSREMLEPPRNHSSAPQSFRATREQARASDSRTRQLSMRYLLVRNRLFARTPCPSEGARHSFAARPEATCPATQAHLRYGRR